MTIRDVAMAVRHRWWGLVLCIVLGGVVGFGAAVLPAPTYSSMSRVVVAVPDVSQDALQLPGGLSVAQRATNYANLATSTDVLQGVIKDLALNTSLAQLTRAVQVDIPIGTTVMQITATAGTATGAQQIAQAVATSLSSKAGTLESALGVANSQVVLTIADPAPLPSKPDASGTVQKGALGLIAGLIVGAGALWLLEYLDGAIRRPEDLADVTGAPVLGTVARAHKGQLPATGAAAEPFRTIRTALSALIAPTSVGTVVVVAGVTDRDSSAPTAANIAAAQAAAGRNTLLIDADLGAATLGTLLGMDRGSGFADALATSSASTLAAPTTRSWESGGTDVLTAGAATASSAGDLLQSPHFIDILDSFRHRYDVIVIAAPAALASVTAAAIGGAADGVILVATWGKTSLNAAKHARDRVTMASGALAGSVVVDVPNYRMTSDADFVPARG
ncbi:MAG: hypothetical protein ABI382_07390 [Nakamurella sp.]